MVKKIKATVIGVCPYALQECTKPEPMDCPARKCSEDCSMQEWAARRHSTALSCECRGARLSEAGWFQKYKLTTPPKEEKP